MNEKTQETPPEWLSGIGAPLQGIPAGEDPRYLDEFQQVKEEIDKLRDADYTMIIATCRDLLTKVAKDLRVAGYLLTAGVYVDGLPGLVHCLMAYRLVLENFWEDCHPKSENGRLAALNLLSSPRIVAFADQKTDGAAIETFLSLQQEIEGINSFLIEKQGEETPRLSALGHWVEERIKRLSPPEPRETPDAPTETPSSGAATPDNREVNSEKKVETLTLQIHRYLMDRGDFIQALAYSRALRWGRLAPPLHEEGRTRIPAPRPGGMAEFEKALSGDSFEKVLACCEGLFFEPGFHFLFDLQFKTFEYLEAHRQTELAGYIRNAIKDLLQRQPGLVELSFDDATPFAGPGCRQWIRQGEMNNMSTGPAAGAPEADGEEAAVIDEATKLAGSKNLAEALQCLHPLPAGTEIQRVRKRLTEACLCLAAGRASMAEVLLAGLQQQITDHHLAAWEPDLAVEILRRRLAALQLLESDGPEEDKERIEKQEQEVRELICKIDVIAAATLI